MPCPRNRETAHFRHTTTTELQIANPCMKLFETSSAEKSSSQTPPFDYKEFFQTTYPDLVRYAQTIVRDAAVAEDLVQEGFLRLWVQRNKLNLSRSPKTFLYVIVRNLAHEHERTQSRHRRLLSTNVDAWRHHNPEATTEAERLEAHLRAWITELPNRQREAFILSRSHGLSYEEIADVMQISTKTVDNHIWLALQHLRRRLRDYDPDSLSA